MNEIRLGGGRSTAGVVRAGETVHRPTGPWTPTIHAFLRHLRDAGFTAAPQVLGFDEQGREVLTYIEGETWGDQIDPDEPKTDLVTLRPWPARLGSDEALAEIGRLFGQLHQAARGFQPTAPIWRRYEFPMKDDEIVSHGDAGPWNVVYSDGLPVALIDWDGAQPARPIDDLATVAWHFVPLGPDDFLRASGFTKPFRTGQRLRILSDAYGLAQREQILPAISRVKQFSVQNLRYWQPLPAATAARHLRITARDLEWLSEAEDDLRLHLR